MDEKQAIIIGAGPAGLTAAYELLHKTKIKPIIYEMSGDVGGISKTVVYKGNRIDIGGHRFFSKSERVMQWWLNILPLQGAPAKDDIILGRDVSLSEEPDAPDPEKADKVMLVRERLSRIFFLKNFFDYPLSLGFNTLSSLGLIRVIKITMSYVKSRVFPIKPEKSLEDFFVNRFGRELYLIFFKDYTQKVWGVPCSKIGAEWGVQRVKGLSISRAIAHAVKSILSWDHSISQKKTETSLIGRFVYPKYGPGQMWEEVAGIVKAKGGELHLRHKVIGLKSKSDSIVEAQIKNEVTGEVTTAGADYFFSTMPVVDLISVLSLVLLNGLRLYQVDAFIDRHLSQIPPLDQERAQVCFIRTWDGYYSIDLVQNDPFLRNKITFVRSFDLESEKPFIQQFFTGAVQRSKPLPKKHSTKWNSLLPEWNSPARWLLSPR